MKRIVKNQFAISVKDASFLRCIFYTIFSAICLVLITWMLGNYLPEMFGEALSQMNENGKIDLGYIVFESFEQIKDMTAESMLNIAYSSPMISIIIGVLTVELFGKNCEDGYFQLLMSRRVSRIRIYLCRIITTMVMAIILYWVFGVVCVIASQFGFGLQFVKVNFIHVLVQCLVVVALVSFFSLSICILRKTVRTVVATILTVIGVPELMKFLASLFQKNKIRYLWIGSCVTNASENDIFILGIAMVYIVFSIGLGCIVFVKSDMS